MIHFCDNPKCKAHVSVSDSALNEISLPEGDSIRMYKRNEYRLSNGKTFSFCDICAEAIKIIEWETKLLSWRPE